MKFTDPWARQSKKACPLTLKEVDDTFTTVFRVAVPSWSAESPVTILNVEPAGYMSPIALFTSGWRSSAFSAAISFEVIPRANMLLS